MPNYTPANHAYHPPLRPPTDHCKQCGESLVFRGDVLCCTACGLPHTQPEAKAETPVEPAAPARRGPGRPPRARIAE